MYYKDHANNVENDNLRSLFCNSMNKLMYFMGNQSDDKNTNNEEKDIIEVNSAEITLAKFIILKWYYFQNCLKYTVILSNFKY